MQYFFAPRAMYIHYSILDSPKKKKPLSLSLSRKEAPKSSSDSKSSEYHCPICQTDLTLCESSVLRQRHVEECLSAVPQAADQHNTSDSFEYCIFCGKNIATWNGMRKEQHFNRCMDEHEATLKAESFVGDDAIVIQTLDICPCCHDTKPFKQKSISQRIAHLKQCTKRRNMTLPQLFRKLQWIQWGHSPREPKLSSIFPSSESIPNPGGQTRTMITMVDDHDPQDDFSSSVIMHRAIPAYNKTNSTRNDKKDEELQTAIALSKSLQSSTQNSPLSKRRDKLMASERNSADIITVEESRRLVLQEFNNVISSLLQDESMGVSTDTVPDTPPLPPSRLGKALTDTSFWTLASGQSQRIDPFISKFLKKNI